MRTALLVLVIAIPTLGQTGLATRQQAVDSINGAIDARVAWGTWVQTTENEIDTLPPGPIRDAIDLAWGGFVAAWNSSDSAADSHIDIANGELADGDAETDPMLKGLHYATAVSWAELASNQMAMLEDDYDTFMNAIAGTGWTPSTSPPN